MKKIMVILLVTVTLGMANKAEAQGYGNISFNTFYNELSPYGRWVDDLDYGQVWIADAPGFEPYYNNGHWVYTSYGWTWASDYAWGWAPFHYGRWTYLPTWGWAWVPGYEWGPAWVGWCQNDGYYGWAPLAPGMGFNISYNSFPNNYWRFVQQQYITGPSIREHIIRPGRSQQGFRNMTIINNTTVNNNTTYVTGPERASVERITRQKIVPRQVAFNGTDERTRVEQREVRMYRPDLRPKAAANTTPVVPQRDITRPVQPVLDRQPNVAVKPLPGNVTPVEPSIKQPVTNPVNRENDRRIKPLPAPRQDNQTAVEQIPVTRMPNEQDARRQQNERAQQIAREQQQNELRQQQLSKQQAQQKQYELQQQSAQQEQLRQQQLRDQQLQQQRAVQEQREQRQNEVRQQQLEAQRAEQQRQNDLRQQQQNEIRRQQAQEQRAQQQQMQQQERQQRQNDIRQQRMQEAPVRPQRQLPVNQKPTRRPFEK
jgi:hypothetical protein